MERRDFVGANLVFALNVRGEHKVRPYGKLHLDSKLRALRNPLFLSF
jgi:hypothetical protein